jgi:2-dehydropantoate 2-reductase
MTQKKIAVVGAGANGAAIGADLTRAGLDVDLIEQWPEHVAAMRERGVRIEMPDETITVEVNAHNLCDVATFTHQYDVVLLLMKAYDAAWATQLIEPYLKPDGLLVGVQNGMSVDDIASVVGPHRTIGTVIECASNLIEPGVISRHTPPAKTWFAVGGVDEVSKTREAEAAELLSHAGTTEIVDNIVATKWMKLISNSTTLVSSGIVGLPLLSAARHPVLRPLMLASGKEALAAAQGLGHPVLPIFGLKPEDVVDVDNVVEILLDVLLEQFTLPHTTTTITYDWSHGRHSEVDDINGRVVAEARAQGRTAPVNAAIVEVAHRIERGELTPDEAHIDLLRELADADIEPSPRLAKS